MAGDSPTQLGGLLSGLGPGSHVAGYLLERLVGVGGMAAVFRARDERLGRVVALKLLTGDEAVRQRFVREARAVAAVDHPHIIPVYEAGEADGILFIAMRFVAGDDLRVLVGREGGLPPRRAAAFISPVASALDAAHGAGLVHRDVKPANMLVDVGPGRPEHVYLSDFGLARGMLSTGGLTRAGQFMGTPDYASPEQISGRFVDGRADQYALACVAYTLLSGSLPFVREEPMAVLYAHLSAPPPRVTAARPELPSAVDHVVARGLAKMPDDRYESCGEFADALREALDVEPYDPARSGRGLGQSQVGAPVRPGPAGRDEPGPGPGDPGPGRPGPGPGGPDYQRTVTVPQAGDEARGWSGSDMRRPAGAGMTGQAREPAGAGMPGGAGGQAREPTGAGMPGGAGGQAREQAGAGMPGTAVAGARGWAVPDSEVPAMPAASRAADTAPLTIPPDPAVRQSGGAIPAQAAMSPSAQDAILPPAHGAIPPPAQGAMSPSAPPASSVAEATWTAVVTADRTYYDSVRAVSEQDAASIRFPDHVPERRFRLAGRQVRIGRRSVSRRIEPEIDLTGPPADPGVSRLHAVLIAGPERSWAVVNPGSANGILVNGTEIPVGEAVALDDGDRIHLGAWTMITITRA